MMNYKDVIIAFQTCGLPVVEGLLREGQTSRGVVRKAAKHLGLDKGFALHVMLNDLSAKSVTLDEVAEAVGVTRRTIQRWVERGRLPKPKRSYGKGAGRGGPATWDASVIKKARDLADAERLISDLRNPLKAPALLAKLA